MLGARDDKWVFGMKFVGDRDGMGGNHALPAPHRGYWIESGKSRWLYCELGVLGGNRTRAAPHGYRVSPVRRMGWFASWLGVFVGMW